ncbi:TPA: hypothetical protein I7730_01015 [Vibrio vulnificus]|uniref:Uncharacterized protein n=1 Tax=Vibrio vulnificus TaxID=672 RepID=A0A8H9MYQ3_VIBVL|nr:hypothetical protein [Vibrio vulnificus]
MFCPNKNDFLLTNTAKIDQLGYLSDVCKRAYLDDLKDVRSGLNITHLPRDHKLTESIFADSKVSSISILDALLNHTPNGMADLLVDPSSSMKKKSEMFSSWRDTIKIVRWLSYSILIIGSVGIFILSV